MLPVGVLQPLDLLRNLQRIGGNRRLHGGQLVLGHPGDDPVHIVFDLRGSIAIVPVDLITDHASASFDLLFRRQLGQPRADIFAEFRIFAAVLGNRFAGLSHIDSVHFAGCQLKGHF